jgi:drug/metabolite transporter (DMT)-like permease
MDKTRLGSILGIVLSVLWGISFLSIKVTVLDIPPMTMAVYRFAIACAVLPFMARLAKESLRVPARDLAAMALGGFTGVTLYFFGENHGVALLTASESSLIVSFIPVLAVVADRVFLGIRASGKVWLGAVLSTAGVFLIFARSAGTSASRLGYLYMLAACVAWVVYGIVTRGVAKRYGIWTTSFWQCLFGLAGCVPFALTESAQWRMPGALALWNLLYLGLACSAAAYWLYIASLNLLGVAVASIFINVIPVVSVTASYLFLGERLNGLQLVGGAVVVAGVFLATGPKGRSGGDPERGREPGTVEAERNEPECAG